jgi:hypothetical protein
MLDELNQSDVLRAQIASTAQRISAPTPQNISASTRDAIAGGLSAETVETPQTGQTVTLDSAETAGTPQASETVTPVKRGRGRPPGSKNKPKPQLEAQAKTVQTLRTGETATPVKRGSSKPPGSKNKPKPQPEAQAKLTKLDRLALPAPATEISDLQNGPNILQPRELTDEEYLDQAEGEIRGYGQSFMNSIIAIGKKLAEIKERVGHGKYEIFVRERLGFSERTALNYVRAYELFKSETVSDLDAVQIDAKALYLLARPSTPEEVRTAALEKARTEGISHAEVQKLIADARAEEARKAKEAADAEASERLAAVKRANEAAVKSAAQEAAALTEQIRRHELAIAQSGQKIAELEAARVTLEQSVRAEIEAQYQGKIVMSEEELKALFDAALKKCTAPLEKANADEKKRNDELTQQLTEIRKQQEAAIKAAAEKAAAAAQEPPRPPIDSKLYSRSMDAARAIEHCVAEIKLSPAECIQIETEVAERIQRRPDLAREELGKIAAAIRRLEPWFDEFLELHEHEMTHEALGQMPRSTSGSPILNTSFRVPRDPLSLAKALFDKLATGECQEIADFLYDHLGTSRLCVETSLPAANHCQIADDVIGRFNVSEQMELFLRMLSRWSKSEISTGYDALIARGTELDRLTTRN